MENKDFTRRIKSAREYLSLTQKYVASVLGLTHSAISDIETGKRSVSSSELKLFSELYGVTIEELIYGQKPGESIVFARTFSNLCEEDQNEIIQLIEFKKRLRENRLAYA